MALRDFKDGEGTSWQVWNVKPTARSASPLSRANRREKRTSHGEPERRKGAFSHTPGLEGGWLCFDSEREKRRLVPAPADWETCPEETLNEYLRRATPTRPARREFYPEGGSTDPE